MWPADCLSGDSKICYVYGFDIAIIGSGIDWLFTEKGCRVAVSSGCLLANAFGLCYGNNQVTLH